MNRFVFDTNSIVSALLLSESVPCLALFRALECGTVLTSPSMVAELREVLGRSRFDRYISPSERNAFLRAFIRETDLVAITDTIQVCRDPKDDRVLEAAVSGRADLIVTGDNDLLVHNPFQGITIVSPAEFLLLTL